MQGWSYKESYKKINVKKHKFNLYKIFKKLQMNHSYLFKTKHNQYH
jgi:hypothetical protein